jgi:hypothetical protein
MPPPLTPFFKISGTEERFEFPEGRIYHPEVVRFAAVFEVW